MLAGKHAGKFHLPDPPVKLRQQLLDFGKGLFVLPLFTKFHEHQQIVKFLLGRIEILDNLLQAGPLFQSLLRLLPLVPEFGPGYFRFEFGYTFALVVDVKDTSSARRAWLAKIQDVIFHHETFSTLHAEN